jgi:hypothetical protein
MTSIKEDAVFNNSILVFPNPSGGSHTFRVTLEKAGMAGLVIMDATGKIMERTAPAWFPAGVSNITSSMGLSNGSYHVILEVNGKPAGSAKLVVNRN